VVGGGGARRILLEILGLFNGKELQKGGIIKISRKNNYYLFNTF